MRRIQIQTRESQLRHVQQCSNDVVEYILCYMHQINIVVSFKILLV
jgi:hypothetical protein